MIIDEKVVQMKFDNSGFRAGAEEAIGLIERLRAQLNFESITSTAGSLLGTMFDTVKDKCLAATAQVEKFAKSLTVDQIGEGFDKYSEKITNVRTIMAATGEDIDTVDAAMERLMWYTDETSYNFSDMANSIGKFTSAGQSIDDSLTAMMGITNWAARSGQTKTQASMVMYNLSQALSTGALKLQDYKSIENANMATKEFKETAIQVALEMGKIEETTDGMFKAIGDDAKYAFDAINGFRDNLDRGWFDTDVIMGVLATYGEFSDTLNKIVNETGVEATTWMGILNKWTDSQDDWNNAMEETGLTMEELSPIIQTLTSDELALSRAAFSAGQEATKFSESIDATKDAVSTQFMRIFESIFGDYEEARLFWTDVTSDLWTIFAGPITELADQFSAWHDNNGRTLLMQGLYDIRDGVFNVQKDIWKALDWGGITSSNLGQVSYWVKGVGEQFKSWTDNTDKVSRWGEVLRKTLEILISLGKDLWNVLKPLFEGLAKISGSVLNGVLNWFEKILGISGTDAQSTFLERLSEGSENLGRNLGDLCDKINSKVQPAFDLLEQGANKIKMAFEKVTNILSFQGSFVDRHLFSSIREAYEGIVDYLTDDSVHAKLVRARDLIYIGNQWDTIVEKYKSGLKPITDAISSVVETVKTKLHKFFKTAITEDGDTIADLFSGNHGFNPKEIANKLTEIALDIADKLEDLTKKAKDKFEEIKTKVTDFVDTAKTKFDEFKDKITEIKEKIDVFNIGETIGSWKDTITDKLTEISGFDSDTIDLTWVDGTKVGAITNIKIALEAFGNMIIAIAPALESAATAVGNGITKMFNSIFKKDEAKDAETTAQSVTGFLEKIKGVFEKIKKWFVDSGIIEAIKNFGTSSWRIIKNTFKAIIDTVNSLAKNTLDATANMTLFDIIDIVVDLMEQVIKSKIVTLMPKFLQIGKTLGLTDENGVSVFVQPINALKDILVGIGLIRDANQTKATITLPRTSINITQVTKLMAAFGVLLAEVIVLAGYPASDLKKAALTIAGVAAVFTAMEKILGANSSLSIKAGSAKILDSISRLIDAGAIATIGKAVIDLTTTFVGLGASSELSENDWDDIGIAISAGLASLLMIMAAFATMKQLEGVNDKGWNSISKSISTFIDSTALKVIASAIGGLSELYIKMGSSELPLDYDAFVAAIVGSVFALGELLVALAWVKDFEDAETKSERFVNAVSDVITGAAMATIAGAMTIIMKEFKSIATDESFDPDKFGWAIVGSVVALGELLAAIGYLTLVEGSDKKSKKFVDSLSKVVTASAMSTIAGAMSIIMEEFKSITDDESFDPDRFGYAIVGSVAALGSLLSAIGFMEVTELNESSTDKIQNSISYLIASGAMSTIADAIVDMVEMYREISSDENIEWDRFAQTVGVATWTLVELIGALAAMTVIIAGKEPDETLTNAISALIASGTLLVIAGAVKDMIKIYDVIMENPDAEWEDFGIASLAMLVSLGMLLAGLFSMKKIVQSKSESGELDVDKGLDTFLTNLSATSMMSNLGKVLRSMMDIYEIVMDNPSNDKWEDFGIATVAMLAALEVLLIGFKDISKNTEKLLEGDDGNKLDTILLNLVSTGIIAALGLVIRQMMDIYEIVMTSDSEKKWEDFGVASLAIATSMVALILAFAGIRQINDATDATLNDIITDLASSGVLLSIALAIRAMAEVYDAFMEVTGDVDDPEAGWRVFEQGTAAMIAGLTTLLVGFKGLKAVNDDDGLTEALTNLVNGGTLVLLAGAVLLATQVFNNFPADRDKWPEMAQTALGMVVTLAILVAGMAAVQTLGGNAKNAITGFISSGSITLLAGSLVEVGLALQLMDGIPLTDICHKLVATFGILLAVSTVGSLIGVSPLGEGLLVFATGMDLLGIAAVAFGFSVKLMADGIVSVIDALKGFKGTDTDTLIENAQSTIDVAAADSKKDIETAATDMVDAFVKALEGMDTRLYEMGESAITNFKDGLVAGAASYDAEDAEITNITNSITKWLEQPLTSFVGSVKKTTVQETTGGGKWYAKIHKAGADTISAFGDGLQNTKLSGKIFDTIADDITTQIANKKSTIEQAGKDAHDYFESGFDYDQFSITSLHDFLLSFQSEDYAEEGQMNWAQSFKLAGSDAGFFWERGFSDRIKLITYEKLSPSFTSMFTALGTVKVKAKTAAMSIGEYIVAGIIEGIDNKKTDLETAIHNVAVSANEVFTNTEEIASPSKVYIRYGQFMVEGLAKGLSNTKPINTAMKNLTVTTNNLADEITGTLADPARWTIVIDADTTSADAKIADLASRFEVVSDAITSETTEDKSPREVYRLDGSSYTYIPDLATAVALANQNGEKKTLSAMEAFALSSERAATAIRKSSIKTENTTESTESQVVNLTVNNNITGQSVEQITNEVKRSLAADLKKKGALLGK